MFITKSEMDALRKQYIENKEKEDAARREYFETTVMPKVREFCDSYLSCRIEEAIVRGKTKAQVLVNFTDEEVTATVMYLEQFDYIKLHEVTRTKVIVGFNFDK